MCRMLLVYAELKIVKIRMNLLQLSISTVNGITVEKLLYSENHFVHWLHVPRTEKAGEQSTN